MISLETGLTQKLEHLFDAELRYDPDVGLIVTDEGREGAHIGNGGGSVTGERISGTIRWSFYTNDCAYVFVQAGLEPPPGQHLCTTNPGGVIETEDGAKIWFDARGYGLRGFDANAPHKWSLTMALQLSTDDERYSWLNQTLSIWVGEFDENEGRSHYRAYGLTK